ncbi:MAG TPA: APC family permease [Candidatus Acidoferrum sp.]|nr:APC family permease [Candidatus Acidoferrum sp.]
MATLAHKLSTRDYFALAFGTMIGSGWLVVMDDWLSRGGPAGGMLAFAIGGILLLPVGWVYGKWVERLRDASGEAAYTAQVFPPMVSYLTGWIMLLAYFIACPWEAVALGKLAAYLYPAIDRWPLYSVAGHTVFLPRLALGIAMTLLLAFLNYRGIRASATFQRWITTIVLLLFAVIVLTSAARGASTNFVPTFHGSPWLSIFLTLQIVPYFMTGFESVPKAAEEAAPGFGGQKFFRAIVMALFVGAGFYVLAIGAVSFATPWRGLLGEKFATAVAFERLLGAQWPVRIILAMAFLGLTQCFNGNFVASTRLLFSYGRRGTVPRAFGQIHSEYLTPYIAVIAITVMTLIGLLLGDSLLVPVTEVGSMASALGWLSACVSFFLIEKNPRARVIALMGGLVALSLLFMKLVPAFPGHFSHEEWIALGIWLALGLTLHLIPRGKN